MSLKYKKKHIQTNSGSSQSGQSQGNSVLVSEIESRTLKTYNLIYIMIYLHKYITNIQKNIFRQSGQSLVKSILTLYKEYITLKTRNLICSMIFYCVKKLLSEYATSGSRQSSQSLVNSV